MGTFSALSAESVEDQERLCRACIRAFGAHRAGRTPAFLIQQLSSIMCPAEVEPVYYLTLQKSPTQEEFIRGGMTKNPYPSSELGASMRDVKRKICIDLDMAGLIEDDNGMELLVRGRVPLRRPPSSRGFPLFSRLAMSDEFVLSRFRRVTGGSRSWSRTFWLRSAPRRPQAHRRARPPDPPRLRADLARPGRRRRRQRLRRGAHGRRVPPAGASPPCPCCCSRHRPAVLAAVVNAPCCFCDVCQRMYTYKWTCPSQNDSALLLHRGWMGRRRSRWSTLSARPSRALTPSRSSP
jgi:hypothetical protein